MIMNQNEVNERDRARIRKSIPKNQFYPILFELIEGYKESNTTKSFYSFLDNAYFKYDGDAYSDDNYVLLYKRTIDLLKGHWPA